MGNNPLGLIITAVIISLFFILGIIFVCYTKQVRAFMIGLEITLNSIIPFSIVRIYIGKYGVEKTKQLLEENKIYWPGTFFWIRFAGVLYICISIFIIIVLAYYTLKQ